MVAGAVLRRLERRPAEASADRGDSCGLGRRIGDTGAAVGARHVADVGKGTAPVGTRVDAGETMLDTEQATEVARVAVGVPARCVDDHQGALEIVVAVQ